MNDGTIGRVQALRLLKRWMGTPRDVRASKRDGFCVLEARMTRVVMTPRGKAKVHAWHTVGKSTSWAMALEQARHGQEFA